MNNRYEVRGRKTAIFLNLGLETIIDTKDLKKMDSYKNKWIAKPNTMGKFYCVGHVGRKIVYLHRYLMDDPLNLVIDHINSDTLDNRRSINLREISQAQNLQNRLISKKNTTGYTGVSMDKNTKKFNAQICIDSKNRRLGVFESKEVAASFVRAAKSIYLPFSKEYGSTDNDPIICDEVKRILNKKAVIEEKQCGNTYSKKGVHFYLSANERSRYCSSSCNVLVKYYKNK